MSCTKLFVGSITTARPNWKLFNEEPTATRSKKPESVANEIAEKKAARAAEAAYSPYTGTVIAATVITEHNVAGIVSNHVENFYVTPGNSNAVIGDVSYRTLKYLEKKITELRERNSLQPYVCLYGLRMQEQLQLMAVDAIKYYNATIGQVDAASNNIDAIPSYLWTHPNFQTPMWRDPYNVLVPTDQRQYVKYNQLVQFYELDIDLQGVESSPQLQAEFAQMLVSVTNL